METVSAPTLPIDPVTELIDLTDPEDPFQRMKSCSVVTYQESTLQRMPMTSAVSSPAAGSRGGASCARSVIPPSLARPLDDPAESV